ncbi:MAG: calcium-translocating P-type ATPase, PMCA-type [Bacilli bacterium]|nr:calcium-translocating P-type ATPase, PMCA-type [Bacilli bacterium]
MNYKTGLTDKEVIYNQEKYGNNEITKIDKNSFIKKFIEALGDPIIKILIIALCIKTIFLFKSFDWFETIGIVIAIFIASFISTISEYGSEQAFIRMQEEASKIKCRVKRNNKIKEINISDVVTGDIVLLDTGDKIPADGILIEGQIDVDESSITGEAKEINKTSSFIQNEKNSLYRGSTVYFGRGNMLVKKVGNQTLYGKLAVELNEKAPDSPLKIKLQSLSKIICYIGYIGAALVTLSHLFYKIIIINNFEVNKIMQTLTNFPLMLGHILYALTLSVTIIIVAVPEGLPMMITLVLSSNMKKMLKNNILVRKLVGIETAGSMNVLLTDKTGTLTKGELEVICFTDSQLNVYNDINELKKYNKLSNILKKSIYYNNSSIFDENNNIVNGNNTDKTILKFLKEKLIEDVKIISINPFNSKNKYSNVIINENNNMINLIKGAPEKIISNVTSYYNNNGNISKLFSKTKINEYVNNVTKKGIRVIALSTSKTSELKEMTLVGLLLIKDEIRKESKEAIELISNAHIDTIMITGDNKETALSIAKEINLFHESDLVLTSDELNSKTDEEIKKIVPKLKIVARALPSDKSRLVKIIKDMNLVVGMTGDGVNDAPALKKADIGFAMGSGTEVAKEASDIVILDDNIISIAKSILFGRTIFKSIRKFIIFQLTVNLCAISLSIIGPFINIDTPVTVIQMLWINMVMDTLAGLAFSFEPPLKEYMIEYPKKKGDSIINKYMFQEIIFTGFYSSFLCIFFLKSNYIFNLFRDYNHFMSAFFGLFIFIGIFNCFNARTERLNLFSNLYKNKIFILVILFIFIVQLILIYHGGSLFRTIALNNKELEIILFLSLTVIPVDWFRKIYLRNVGKIGGV